jgi:hypothetical protein
MVAMAAATAAPGAAASTPAQRVSVLERTAGVLRDTAMEKWEGGRRLDALSVSIVSLTALREAYKLARVAALAATKAESEATVEAAAEAAAELKAQSAVAAVAVAAAETTVADDTNAEALACAPTTSRDHPTALTAPVGPAPHPSIPLLPLPHKPSIPSSCTPPSPHPQKLRRDTERAVKTMARIKSAFAAALQRAERAAAAVKVGFETPVAQPSGSRVCDSGSRVCDSGSRVCDSGFGV